jgi:hypothetical protein
MWWVLVDDAFGMPKFAVILSILLMVFTIEVWRKKYWTLTERLHFSMVTLASMVFVILSYHLNLIVRID